MNTPAPKTLSIAALEKVYDQLAEAIDASGEHSETMLVKLALLLAEHIGDDSVVLDLIKRAQRDLNHS